MHACSDTETVADEASKAMVKKQRKRPDKSYVRDLQQWS